MATLGATSSTTTVDKTMVGLSNVDNTSDANKPVSTAQQTALDLKAPLANPVFTGGVTLPAGTVTLAMQANMATASVVYRKTAGSGAPEVNTLAQLKTDLVLVKADVGLGSVDNTSDAAKPVSSATQTALNAKQDTLVSATNIKTVNSTTLLGSGDLAVQAVLVSATNIKTINGASVLGSGDLVVTGAAPDIALSLRAPAVDETITAGYSAAVARKYTIASGKKLTVGSGAIFRVL